MYKVMTAIGRKRTLKTADFCQSERPLLGKADIEVRIPKIRLLKGRIGPGSGRSLDMMLTGCS